MIFTFVNCIWNLIYKNNRRVFCVTHNLHIHTHHLLTLVLKSKRYCATPRSFEVLCCVSLKKQMTYNFQRWMSWLPQRWRTQRNAIRNANCITSWIIKPLNAYCASGIFLVAYLAECPRAPLVPPHVYIILLYLCVVRVWFCIIKLCVTTWLILNSSE